MHDRLHLTQAKMPDDVQLELLAPWYTQHPSESRTLDFFDAIPKYPFAVTTANQSLSVWTPTPSPDKPSGDAS